MHGRFLIALLILLCLSACTRGDSGLEGTVLFREQPLAEAQVEIYLRGEQDRSTAPFAVTSTDERGRFRLSLPAGRYFVIGKKREELPGGQTRMLMAECPANPLEVGDGLRRVPPFSLREMGRDGALVADPGTGLHGRLTVNGEPLAGGFVYIYVQNAAGLMGPSYGEAVQSDEAGAFHFDLPAGRYFLAARKRADGARMGEPAIGDLNGVFAGNPVEVALGEILGIGDFPLLPVEAENRQLRQSQGKFTPTATAFSGRVVDADRRPVRGVYVFAYLDSRMVGKPSYISAATGTDGLFTLYLSEGGTYHVGARSTFGGPLEPGEWVGTYDRQSKHAASIENGQNLPLGDIVVREVW
jgi:hypothetical protein